MSSSIRFRSVLQMFTAIYVIYSVLFTTRYLIWSSSQQGSGSSLWPSFITKHMRPGIHHKALHLDRRSESQLHFDYKPPSALSEGLFLSKAFSQSLRPTNIIPYFYRANGKFESQDITITTIITNNRFEVFSQLVQRYQGPISVTVHIKNSSEDRNELLQELHNLYASSPLMARYVDVHLVLDSFERQFNTWRNIARFFARTDFVLMLDVDFVPCTDFRKTIKENERVQQALRDGSLALVLPAFEYIDLVEGKDQSHFPEDKETLVDLVNAGRVGMFHQSWPAGHNGTDYDRFYAAQPGEVYQITQYQSAYEPYVILKKDGPPWCDERFIGYGANKAACLFEMYISGLSFHVLADDFLVHKHHLYEETVRRPERKYNRRVYTEFKEEACLRYLRGFHESGLLNEAVASNARQECSKIRSVVRAVPELLSTTLT